MTARNPWSTRAVDQLRRPAANVDDRYAGTTPLVQMTSSEVTRTPETNDVTLAFGNARQAQRCTSQKLLAIVAIDRRLRIGNLDEHCGHLDNCARDLRLVDRGWSLFARFVGPASGL
jgi:hypothetical protein